MVRAENSFCKPLLNSNSIDGFENICGDWCNVACFEQNAATHIDNLDKNTVTMDWTAPAGFVGTVLIKYDKIFQSICVIVLGVTQHICLISAGPPLYKTLPLSGSLLNRPWLLSPKYVQL
jgi:hypothetical protein